MKDNDTLMLEKIVEQLYLERKYYNPELNVDKSTTFYVGTTDYRWDNMSNKTDSETGFNPEDIDNYDFESQAIADFDQESEVEDEDFDEDYPHDKNMGYTQDELDEIFRYDSFPTSLDDKPQKLLIIPLTTNVKQAERQAFSLFDIDEDDGIVSNPIICSITLGKIEENDINIISSIPSWEPGEDNYWLKSFSYDGSITIYEDRKRTEEIKSLFKRSSLKTSPY